MSRTKLKCIITCAVLFIAFVVVTANETEADVTTLLGKMPAASTQEGYMISAELVKLGPDSIMEICKMLVPPGSGDDTKARYALHGLSWYVYRPGAEKERKMYEGVLINSLDSIADSEVKAFLICQLQLVGKKEAVAPLGRYLNDERLCEPATQALLAIRTSGAVKELTRALPSATDKNLITIIQGLGVLRAKKTAGKLINYTTSDDAKIRLAALHALANIGAHSKWLWFGRHPSEGILAKAAETTSSYERAKTTSYYLLYAQRIAEAGKKERCAEICHNLIKTRTAPGEENVQCAALSTLVDALGKNAVDDLLASMDNNSREVRAAALKLANRIPDKSATEKWIGRLKTVRPEMRTEILTMLGYRGDKSAIPALLNVMKDSDNDVRAAAVMAVARVGGNDALHTIVADMKSDDASVKSALINALSAWPDAEFFVSIFNGRDLTGWTGNIDGYVVEDSTIVVYSDRGGGNVYTAREYSDFILRFEFKLTAGANNGLGIRAPLTGDAAYQGMELQIIDNTADQYKDLKPYQYHGSIYGVVPSKRGYLKPVGEWNYQMVIASGRQIIVILNGETIVDADIYIASTPKTIDGNNHPGLKRDKGHIGFLGHGSRVEFRNIRIKELQ